MSTERENESKDAMDRKPVRGVFPLGADADYQRLLSFFDQFIPANPGWDANGSPTEEWP
jgi:hypothetical protein